MHGDSAIYSIVPFLHNSNHLHAFYYHNNYPDILVGIIIFGQFHKEQNKIDINFWVVFSHQFCWCS